MEPGPVPMRAAALPTGHQMSVQTVRLGWHWQPYQYIRTASDVNGAQVARLPQWLAELGHEALTDAGWEPSAIACYRRDTALVKYYADGARRGMHQDKDAQPASRVAQQRRRWPVFASATPTTGQALH